MVDVVSYHKSRLNDTSTEVWDIIQKMPPIKDEGNLMSNVYIVSTPLVGWERLILNHHIYNSRNYMSLIGRVLWCARSHHLQ